MKNLAFHRLLRLKMIILHQLSVHHLYISLQKVGRMYFFSNLGVKGLTDDVPLKVKIWLRRVQTRRPCGELSALYERADTEFERVELKRGFVMASVGGAVRLWDALI